jgi:(5-formylfuran-3-yl)methyl phosphate synthase
MPGCRPVAVAYADWRRAKAPPPAEVCAFARDEGCGAFLIDTWSKDGTTLLDWLSRDEIAQLRQTAGVPVALAGSLGPAQIRELLPLRPDWFAVRGSVCKGGRLAQIDPVKVRQLADLLATAGRES